MKTQFVFRRGLYLSPNFRYVAYLGLIGGVMFMVTNMVVFGIALFLICLPPSFLSERICLDVDKKSIKSYKYLFGLEFGKPIFYNELKGIKTKEGVQSQNLGLRVNTTTIRTRLLYARLYFDKKSILLDKSEDLVALHNEMKNLSETLGIPYIKV